MTQPPDAPGPRCRLDKWLWQARFFKSRSLAAAAVEAGMRVNGTRVTKPATAVRPGDTLTFVQGDRARVIEVAAIGARRGPASEAQTLYRSLDPPPGNDQATAPSGGPRPTKADRRALDVLRRSAP